MRTLITILITVLIIAGSAFAQQSGQGITAKGIKLGFGASMMTTEYDILKKIFDYKIGIHAGAFLTYGLSPKLSVQPELLLSVKGTNQGGIFSIIDLATNYVEVPILLKYNLAEQSSLRPTIYAGPSIAYLTSAELNIIFIDPINVTDYMKRVDFGMAFGSSFDIKRFTFETRYTLGLTDIINAADKINKLTGADSGDRYYFPADPKVKNRFLSFMLGYKF